MTVDMWTDPTRSDETETHRKVPGLFSALITTLSATRLGRYGNLLGELAYRIDRRHRIIVQHNLQFAFPSWKEHRIAEVSRRVFHNIGKTLTEMIHCTQMSPDEIRARCRLKGEEHFLRALEAGRGIVLVSAHLGSWELGLQYLACHFGKRVHLVVRPLAPPTAGSLGQSRQNLLREPSYQQKASVPENAESRPRERHRRAHGRFELAQAQRPRHLFRPPRPHQPGRRIAGRALPRTGHRRVYHPKS